MNIQSYSHKNYELYLSIQKVVSKLQPKKLWSMQLLLSWHTLLEIHHAISVKQGCIQWRNRKQRCFMLHVASVRNWLKHDDSQYPFLVCGWVMNELPIMKFIPIILNSKILYEELLKNCFTRNIRGYKDNFKKILWQNLDVTKEGLSHNFLISIKTFIVAGHWVNWGGCRFKIVGDQYNIELWNESILFFIYVSTSHYLWMWNMETHKKSKQILAVLKWPSKNKWWLENTTMNWSDDMVTWVSYCLQGSRAKRLERITEDRVPKCVTKGQLTAYWGRVGHRHSGRITLK